MIDKRVIRPACKLPIEKIPEAIGRVVETLVADGADVFSEVGRPDVNHLSDNL